MADGLEMSAPVNCTDGLHGAAVLAPRGSLPSHVLFSTLMLLGRWAYPDSKLVLLLGLLALGAGIEVAQEFTGWRTGDLADWVADAVGVALVWVM